MPNIVVSGLINIETSCPIKQFPINYFPIDYPFGKVNSCISGVGFNLISNLKVLGVDTTFISMVGNDLFGRLILKELEENRLDYYTKMPEDFYQYIEDDRIINSDVSVDELVNASEAG